MLTDEGREEVNDEAKKRDTDSSSYRWIIEQADKSSGRVFALAEHWNSLDDPDTGGIGRGGAAASKTYRPLR